MDEGGWEAWCGRPMGRDARVSGMQHISFRLVWAKIRMTAAEAHELVQGSSCPARVAQEVGSLWQAEDSAWPDRRLPARGVRAGAGGAAQHIPRTACAGAASPSGWLRRACSDSAGRDGANRSGTLTPRVISGAGGAGRAEALRPRRAARAGLGQGRGGRPGRPCGPAAGSQAMGLRGRCPWRTAAFMVSGAVLGGWLRAAVPLPAGRAGRVFAGRLGRERWDAWVEGCVGERCFVCFWIGFRRPVKNQLAGKGSSFVCGGADSPRWGCRAVGRALPRLGLFWRGGCYRETGGVLAASRLPSRAELLAVESASSRLASAVDT